MSDLSKRTVSIEKTLKAPIELVWKAWTQAEHIAQWWGPKGMDVKVIEHDFKVGGLWKYSMLMPNGSEFISDGKYLEILPLEKIVSLANFKPMTEGVEIHSLFKAEGDLTHFTFKVIHETEEYRIQQEKMGIYNGWGSAFDRLEEFLSQ